MEVPINYLAVLAAAIAGMAVGFLWHTLFGKYWMALSGMSESQLNEMKAKGMGKSYALAFVGTLVMAYVLLYSLVFASSYLGVYGAKAGIMAGFWNWLGFIAPVTLGRVLWEGKSFKFWIFTNGHQLLALVVMGIVLAVWR